MSAFITPALPNVHAAHARRSSRFCARKPVTATLSDVLIVGANRGLGDNLTSLLRDTKALSTTHRPSSAPGPSQLAYGTAHKLEPTDRDATKALLDRLRPQTVVCCIGTDNASQPASFAASRTLIDSCKDVNVSRFVLISALGACESESSVPPQVMQTLRPMLLEKSHAEQHLRDSKLPWTILRPTPIVDDDASDDSAVITEGLACYGTVSRPGLARAVAKAAESERAIGRVLHVVNRHALLITSPYVRPRESWEALPFDEFQL